MTFSYESNFLEYINRSNIKLLDHREITVFLLFSSLLTSFLSIRLFAYYASMNAKFDLMVDWRVLIVLSVMLFFSWIVTISSGIWLGRLRLIKEDNT